MIKNVKHVQVNEKDEFLFKPLQVEIRGRHFEEGIRKFRTLVQSEGILAEYKQKSRYEKPSDKKKRKMREAKEYRLMVAAREAAMASGEWDKRQARKQAKQQEKLKLRQQQIRERSLYGE